MYFRNENNRTIWLWFARCHAPRIPSICITVFSCLVFSSCRLMLVPLLVSTYPVPSRKQIQQHSCRSLIQYGIRHKFSTGQTIFHIYIDIEVYTQVRSMTSRIYAARPLTNAA